jgi:hypothetical protein
LNQFIGLVWLLLLLGPLLFLQRRLHFEVQAIFLLLTRRVDLSIILFSILFFPGVLLHEGSHYLMARLLRVPTGRFSIIPKPMPGGKLQLGYVETAKVDWLRDSLVGAAPFLTGALFVAYAGLIQMGLLALYQAYQSGGPSSVTYMLPELVQTPDFWIWFYLVFTISSTMLPSASDRKAWLPIGIIMLILLALLLYAGAGPWLVEDFAPLLNQLLLAIDVVLLISVAVHFLLWLPTWGLRALISKLTKRTVS